jgi:ankyrin repeat protein
VEDNDGKTSFDYARNVRKREILQALINNKYGTEEDSLLHLAAMMDKINAVRYLIGRGVDVNSKNALHHTPLHLAAGIVIQSVCLLSFTFCIQVLSLY